MGEGWQAVDIKIADRKITDILYDDPHTGEDFVRSIRFLMDVNNNMFLAIATQNWQKSITEQSPVNIEVYDLHKEMTGNAVIYLQFQRLKKFTSAKLYCNSDMALHRELGITLPNDYSGKNNESGCQEDN